MLAVGAVAAAAPSTVVPATINIKPSQSQKAAVAIAPAVERYSSLNNRVRTTQRQN